MAASGDPTPPYDTNSLVQHLLDELRRKDDQLDAATANEALLLRQLTDQRRHVNPSIQGRSYEELQDEVERLRETVMSLQTLLASVYEQQQATRKREARLDSTVSACCDTVDNMVRCLLDLQGRVDGLERQPNFFSERLPRRAPPTRNEEGDQYANPYWEHRGRELVPAAERESYSVATRQEATSEIFTQTTTTELRVQVSQSQTICYRGRDSGFDGSSSSGMVPVPTTCHAVQDSTDSTQSDGNYRNNPSQPSQCIPPSHRPEIVSHSLSLPPGITGSESHSSLDRCLPSRTRPEMFHSLSLPAELTGSESIAVRPLYPCQFLPPSTEPSQEDSDLDRTDY